MKESHSVECRIRGYGITLKKKHSRQGHFSAKEIFDILNTIKMAGYKRKDLSTGWREVGEFELSLEFPNWEDLNVEGTTSLNFILDKETRENFSIKDDRGRRSHMKLPTNKNLCFLTHGSFIFEKYQGELRCVLVMERRHATIGVNHLIKYLEKFLPGERVLQSEQIAFHSDVLKRLDSLRDAKYALIKNRSVTMGKTGGIGTRVRESREERVAIEVEPRKLEIDLVGSTNKSKLEYLWKVLTGRSNSSPEEVEAAVKQTKLRVYARMGNSKKRDWINVFADLGLTKFPVKLGDAREIDSDEFFKNLKDFLSPSCVSELFDIAFRVNK